MAKVKEPVRVCSWNGLSDTSGYRPPCIAGEHITDHMVVCTKSHGTLFRACRIYRATFTQKKFSYPDKGIERLSPDYFTWPWRVVAKKVGFNYTTSEFEELFKVLE